MVGPQQTSREDEGIPVGAARGPAGDRNLQVIFGVTLTAVMAVSSITPAFPAIAEELGISDARVGLLITVYTLPGVFLSPFLGVAADRLGRRRVLIPALLLFAAAGTAAAFARDFDLLLGLRTLQGVGGAPLGSLAVTLIGDLYSGPERARAMGINASVLSVGTAAYPAIGGALALLGWHYPFALALLAVPVALGVIFLLDNPEPERSESVLLYLRGVARHLKNLRLLAFFAAGVLAFVFIYGSFLTYFSLLMGRRFGASSFEIGIVVTSASIATAFVSPQLGRVNRYFSLGRIIRAAFVVYAVGLALIPLIPSFWLLLLPSLIFGTANGLNIPSIMTGVAGLAPLEYRGAFMSVNSVVIRAGQTLGPLMVGLLWVGLGMNGTFYASAGLALFAVVVAGLFQRRSRT